MVLVRIAIISYLEGGGLAEQRILVDSNDGHNTVNFGQ